MKKWKCTVCGQVFEGDAPPVPCPVCGAGENAFVLLEETAPTRWRCTVCGQYFDGDKPPVPCPVCGAGENAFERVVEEVVHFKQDTDDKFVIIGGGLAGLEAAKAIRTRNETASITILADEPYSPYNRPALSDVMSDGLSFVNLLLEQEDFYQQNNIQLLVNSAAVSIDAHQRQVKLENGQTLPYTKLLLATGSKPFNPLKCAPGAVPLMTLRCYDDAMEIIRQATKKRVVLVGGGILGLEAAIALRERGASVTIVELAPHIMPLQTDDSTAALLAARLEHLGFHLRLGVSVSEVTATGVTLSNGDTLAADFVLASMGVRSEVSLAAPLGIDIARGIIVNDFMHTSQPDIWAAGDCAEYGGVVQALAGAASAMGSAAGASMAGDESAPYQPFIPATAFEISKFSLFSVGTVGKNEEEKLAYQNKNKNIYKQLYFAKGRLAGALFVNENPGAQAIHAVAEKAPLSRALDLLR